MRSASAAPPRASGVRPRSSTRCGCLLPRVVPSGQTTRLHPMCKTSAEQLHRQREPQRTQKRHVVSGLTQRRGHLSEPSSGAHRLASIGYSPPCSSQHSVRLSTWGAQLPKLLEPRPQQGSVRPARAPLSAGAVVTITTTSAKGAGGNKSRRSHSPPTCARGTAPPQVSCRRPDSRRQVGQGGCAAATAAWWLCLNLPPPRGTLRAARPRTAARKRPPQPRATLGGHAGVGGSGGRRGGWLANGLAVGDETRLGEGALSVRSMTTGLGGSS